MKIAAYDNLRHNPVIEIYTYILERIKNKHTSTQDKFYKYNNNNNNKNNNYKHQHIFQSNKTNSVKYN